jgi:hypothetical protein
VIKKGTLERKERRGKFGNFIVCEFVIHNKKSKEKRKKLDEFSKITDIE